jgi:CRISPR/Cas system-associated exonuclease Cas4 (RecB family)
MISVSDLRRYFWCGRGFWLSKKARISLPNVGYSAGRRFHTTVHGISELILQAYKAQIPGRIVGTEVELSRGDLRGRIDLIREIVEDGEKGYLIQDEKFTDPPRRLRVWPEDKIQIDAYAYLAEDSKFSPVRRAVIMYNDLIPREVMPAPQRIPEFVEKVKGILESDAIPPRGLWERDKAMNTRDIFEKCRICGYYPLCQVLPVRTRISLEEIRALRLREEERELAKQLEASIEALGR